VEGNRTPELGFVHHETSMIERKPQAIEEATKQGERGRER